MAINSLMDKTICPGSFLVNSLISPTSIIHYYRTKPTGWLDLGFSSGRSSWSSLHASSTRLVYITYHQLFRTSHWSKVQWQNTLHQTEQESLWVQTSCQKLVSLPRYRSEGERISPIKNNPCHYMHYNCIMIVYTDDCLIIALSQDIINVLVKSLSENYLLEDQDNANDYLGIRIIKVHEKIPLQYWDSYIGSANFRQKSCL